jgi:hypothetical protein
MTSLGYDIAFGIWLIAMAFWKLQKDYEIRKSKKECGLKW